LLHRHSNFVCTFDFIDNAASIAVATIIILAATGRDVHEELLTCGLVQALNILPKQFIDDLFVAVHCLRCVQSLQHANIGE
jgi:energy-converting hydrogenase Eha subunit G